MNRLTRRLEQCRAGNRLLLAGYLPAGWPDRDGHVRCLRAAVDAGADAMEIAMPNPPLPLDGPQVQHASRIGAGHVDGAADALRLAARGRGSSDAAIIALFYRHAHDELGIDDVLATCVDNDVDALLLPQHPLSEQIEVAHRSRAAGLEQVLFVHLEQDLPLLAASRLDHPVIYLQSADLRTGGPFDADKAHERLGEVRDVLGVHDASVLVGFGVRGRAEVRALRPTTADGVIMGSAMVEAAGTGSTAVGKLVAEIRPELRRRAAHV